jgi:hypothetical protein
MLYSVEYYAFTFWKPVILNDMRKIDLLCAHSSLYISRLIFQLPVKEIKCYLAQKFGLVGCWDLYTSKCVPTFRKTILTSYLGSSYPRRASRGLLSTEDGDRSLLRNVGNWVPVDKAQHSRRLLSSSTLLSEPSISHYLIILYLHSAILFACTLYWLLQMFSFEIQNWNSCNIEDSRSDFWLKFNHNFGYTVRKFLASVLYLTASSDIDSGTRGGLQLHKHSPERVTGRASWFKQ